MIGLISRARTTRITLLAGCIVAVTSVAAIAQPPAHSNAKSAEAEETEETSEAAHAEGGSAFSEWVGGLELTGCQRGQTVSKVAKQGPKNFESADTSSVPIEDLPGNCAGQKDTEASTEKSHGRPDDPGAHGRARAGENTQDD